MPMRKLYLSALPLVLLFAPFYVRLLAPSSTRVATEATEAAAKLMSAAERADRELGEKVDTESDAGLLADLQIDATKLAEDFDDQSPAVG